MRPGHSAVLPGPAKFLRLGPAAARAHAAAGRAGGEPLASCNVPVRHGVGCSGVSPGHDAAPAWRGAAARPGPRLGPPAAGLVVELGPMARPRPDFFERLAACWTIAPAGTPVESLPFVVATL